MTTTRIALLRGINVGGHKLVSMSDLREVLTNMGFAEVRSLLQSGNLVFNSDSGRGAALEERLETETAKRLGLQTSFFVRSAKEWKALVADNPFRKEAERDPGHLLVMLVKDAPRAGLVKALQDAILDREVVRAGDRHAYIVYPDGVGRSRLTHALIEKKLETRGTARNWNTVLKLAALASS